MKKLSITIFSIIIVLGGLIVATKFLSDKVYAKRARLVDIQKDIQRTEERQKSLKNLEDLLGRVEDRKDTIESAFVNERSVVRVIETLEQYAGDIGLELEVESATLPSGGNARGPELQLHVTGTFDMIYRYIQILEALPFQFSFDVAGFGKSGGETGNWSGTIKFTVLSFIPQS